MNKLRIANKKIDAIYTVEAAFIMPIIFFLILTLFYIGFYLKDKSKIQTVIDLSVMKGSFILRQASDISTGEVYYNKILEKGIMDNFFSEDTIEENVIADEIRKELENTLIITEIEEITVDIKKGIITAYVKASLNISVNIVAKKFENIRKRMYIESKAYVHKPAEFVRISKTAFDTTSSIEGLKKLKESIGKFIKTIR